MHFNRWVSACILAAAAVTSQQSIAAIPVCNSANSDSDGDGYGWENGQSCIVQSTTTNSMALCASASSDPDGDGYGWENGASCLVSSGGGNTGGSGNNGGGNNSSGLPACALTSSDPDGDGYGWENNASCQITAESGAGNNAGSGSSDGGQAGNGNNGIINNDGGGYSSDNVGQTVIRSSSLINTGSREICTQADGDWFGWLTIGDFILHNNTWAAWASSNYNWSQCIYTNKNGAVAGVSYDWGSGGGSGDYQVRSYPELIFGIKDQYRATPKSVTGLPVSIGDMPDITIDYSMSWPEYGPERAVNASANSRYPNGTMIQGERNVSAESFFYFPDAAGNCSENIVTRDGTSNHTYEVMVWLNAGAERLPAGPNDYVTSVQLDGQPYKVYTKNSDRKYIAFVAQNPQQTGSLNWNTFIDWSRQYAHQVQSVFGASTNTVEIQDSWCMANIIIGTEIFWGAGSLDYFDWTITQRR